MEAEGFFSGRNGERIIKDACCVDFRSTQFDDAVRAATREAFAETPGAGLPFSMSMATVSM